MVFPVVYLVRHGETEWNLVRRYQGWGDSPLTERGLAQAEAVGRVLAEISAATTAQIISSPLGRARRTAEIIGSALGNRAPILLEERLKEISIGAWDGLLRDEIEAIEPGVFDRYGYGEWYFRCPGGETYAGFAARIGGWLNEEISGARIVVTHGIVTRVLRGLYAGLPRATALRLPVPQGLIWRLAGGQIEEIATEIT
jgi:probable phosphoglycerate mutase